MIGSGVRVAGRAREARRDDVELVDPIADPPFGESAGRGLEGARLDDVAADGEKRLVDAADDVGPRQHEIVVTALERLAAEIRGGEVVALDVGPHGAVVDEHAIERGPRDTSAVWPVACGCGRPRARGFVDSGLRTTAIVDLP